MKRPGGNRKSPKGCGGVLVLAGFGALMYLKNRMIPKYADDYAFSFIWDGKHHGNLAYGDQKYRRVRNLKDLVRSQISHYFTWSGRTVAETMNQLVLMKDDKKTYDILNTAAILLQILLCAAAGRGSNKKGLLPASLAALLAGGYWFGAPYNVHTVFWTTGAANYSWPGLFQSAFLLPYSYSFRGIEHKGNAALMAVLGLLAGWTNEAGGTVSLLLSSLCCFHAKKKGKMAAWMAAGSAGALVGYTLLMLAPGNYRRFQIEKEYSDIMPEDFNGLGNVPAEYVYTGRMFLSHFVNGFIPVIIRQLPLKLPVLICMLQKEGCSKETLRYLACLETASFGVPLLLMLSPEYPVRAAYVSVLFSMTSAACAFESLLPDSLKKWEGTGKAIAFFGTAAFMINYISSLIADADLHCEIDDQIRTLLESDRNEDALIIPNVAVSDFWSYLAGDRSLKDDLLQATWLDRNPQDPYNKAVAAYYGTGSFSVEPVERHPYRQKGREALINRIKKPCISLCRRIKDLILGRES